MKSKDEIIRELEELCTGLNKEMDELRKDKAYLEEKISRMEKLEKEPTFSESIPDYKKLCAELQDQHQSDCITINQLNVALDIMCDKYSKLREIHGL